MSSGKSLYEKVFDKHVVKKLPSGQYQLFIGLHLIHEVTSPQAFGMLRDQKLKVRFPERTFATPDHIVPTSDQSRPFKDAMSEEMMCHLENNCAENDIKLFDMKKGEQGVVHIIGPENGLTQPGMVISCGDSHTSTHGAFGSIAFGIGTSQVRDVLATQTLAMAKLKVRKIEINGSLNPGVYAKDVILYIINQLGVNGGVGYAYEFSGDVITNMSMEERMTVCNMSIEGGARVGYINPDEKTFDYLKGKLYSPTSEEFDKAKEFWQSISSDEDAEYNDVIVFQGDAIEPMVTWGITPAQSIGIKGSIPALDSFNDDERPLIKEAFEYMGFDEGQEIESTKVDVCFIGSCTNGRLSDFKEVARLVKGRHVADHVQALIVPGSQKIKVEAEKLGLDKIFIEAGFEWREAGCSMCLAMNPDKLKGNQVSASSSNRNFKGRQGSPTGRTLLMSPAMVAAAAICGGVADCREVFAN
ncbi:MAG: 3-isopropylmalate dehydratase large subunit [Planctomycetota bacterium]|nr:MAG: 3-isopropylmalate dehydratase large subunit [Planctomycetota bacterium]